MTKARQLREMLRDESLGFLMEAHNGLSARIAEEAGLTVLEDICIAATLRRLDAAPVPRVA